MSVAAQGSQLYVIDETGSTPVILEIGCITNLNLGGDPSDRLDDTCLSATTRSYKPGLRDPAAATADIRPDPADISHIFLDSQFRADPSPDMKFALGWSDGIGIAPTLDSAGDFELPTTRTFTVFTGYVADLPFDFATNSLVSGTASIQRSSGLSWVRKA